MKLEPSAKVGGAANTRDACHRDFRRAFSSLDFLIVIGTIVVLGTLFFIETRRPVNRSQRISCINNLKMVGLGLRVWAVDYGGYPMTSTNSLGTVNYTGNGDAFRHFQAIGNEIGSSKVVVCPDDRARKPALDFTNGFGNHTLSYFINLDAREENPGAMMAGDRHLSTNQQMITSSMLTLTTNTAVQWTSDLHKGEGNVVLADGSAQQLNTTRLRKQLLYSTNQFERLLFP